MNVGSLFSGVGGLDEGLRRAGHEHVFFCESDPYRREVLAARFPGVPVFDDVGSLGKPAWGVATDAAGASVDFGRWEAGTGLLCGGFPCQDLSVAGRRAGLAGSRSGLFFEFARIIESLRPGWVLVENVPGLLSSNGGRDFGVVLATLADLGYGVAWRILDSRFFGVPQRRRRVFIVGALADGDPRAAAERAGEILAVGSGCERHLAPRGEARQEAPVASSRGADVTGPLTNAAGSRGWKVSAEDAADGKLVARTLMSHDGNDKHDPSLETYVAAPLTKGSATGDGVNQPGRRQEDDVNIVAYPISGDALRGEGTAKTPSADAEGVVRLRDPGLGVGDENDPAFTPTKTHPGAVATVTLASDPITAENLAQPSTRRNGDPGVVVGEQVGVRRLTPIECERLQGFPDGWTQLGDTPDSRRYSALGDAVTVNVAEWIGGRLAA